MFRQPSAATITIAPRQEMINDRKITFDSFGISYSTKTASGSTLIITHGTSFEKILTPFDSKRREIISPQALVCLSTTAAAVESTYMTLNTTHATAAAETNSSASFSTLPRAR